MKYYQIDRIKKRHEPWPIHFRRWKKWKKNCLNGWVHKLLVLLGLSFSPTFEWTLLDEEENSLYEAYQKWTAPKN